MFFGDLTVVLSILVSIAVVVLFLLRCFKVIKWKWWIVTIPFVIVVAIWLFVIWVLISLSQGM